MASITSQISASHEATSVTQQKQNWRSIFFGMRYSSQHVTIHPLRFHFRTSKCTHGESSVNIAGTDRVDPDGRGVGLVTPLCCEGAGQLLYGGFRRVVCGSIYALNKLNLLNIPCYGPIDAPCSRQSHSYWQLVPRYRLISVLSSHEPQPAPRGMYP